MSTYSLDYFGIIFYFNIIRRMSRFTRLKWQNLLLQKQNKKTLFEGEFCFCCKDDKPLGYLALKLK